MGIATLLGGTAAGSADAANKAAKSAAAAQVYGIDQSTALAREQLDYIKSIMAPYQQAGQAALPALAKASSAMQLSNTRITSGR